ncbi:rRNA processing/ribosome biogenesis domain-containing protein [Hirsutella rhossiliensis]|uniref:Pre-rRNA-processing protein RIX1 n=1 Tax=Hirsutella rhossiliensis TaxID=111463 RepID=A0A9P8SKI7_9HYPO|nr:rRNA processing/ribosome biogenesis domain-containing protein [Hirsutella rhossiliensis]KAH0965941.1 rRNA processing/ribosome biogenesis domain-containing protein [Hirsutella rhossiliensis]
MASQLPPDLRVLCRKLSSIPPAQLPHALPALTRHVARCRHVLSTPQEQKPKDDASQVSLLVHKLKTSITALLTGRNLEARFAAVGLVKAVVDVGGWETLRGAEPWVRELLAILQKGDSLASKELAVVTLTRIYVLVHPYQTLVREIATPTIPAFAKACIQIIKPAAPGQTSTVPAAIMETICNAFSTLIPLYPTTFRPCSSQARSAVRGCLAPTSSDSIFVSQSQQRAAGRLTVSLHQTAAKSGGSDEWAKMVDSVLRELHATADQVFRAVDESWQPTEGYGRAMVDADGEPNGGSASSDQLPRWTGLSAGAQRLVGLFHHLADYIHCPTKGPVTVPVGAIVNAISRVCLIAKLSPKSQTWDQAVETNPAIGREEKEELWSLMPDIHVAAMDLTLVMLRRLEKGMVPLAPELSDHLVRIFRSGMDIPAVRRTCYLVLDCLLSHAGPTMSKPAVAMFEPLVAACCRDLQQDAGFLKPSSRPSPTAQDSKKSGGVANVDLFLQPAASAAEQEFSLDADHKAAAVRLLPVMFSNLPQQHLKPTLRGLLDKTAILTRSRQGMLSSVLHPYQDQRGRMFPSILPHMSRQYPQDQGLEIIRSNLRIGSVLGESKMYASMVETEEEVGGESGDAMAIEDDNDDDTGVGSGKGSVQAATLPKIPQIEDGMPVQNNPFALDSTGTSIPRHDGNPADLQSKRKHEGADPNPPKRQELEKPTTSVDAGAASRQPAQQSVDEEDDDSDVSVHLNMELEDDDEDEVEDEADE